MSKDREAIKASILKSKKYRHIYEPTIDRIIDQLSEKYEGKVLEKEVKRRMHLVWGAYFTRPNFNKLDKKLRTISDEGGDMDKFTREMLMLQTSTKERLGFIDDFYPKIFSHMNDVKSVVEYGCGVNALTYKWMGDVEYVGYDVDQELCDFCNRYFEVNGYDKAEVRMGDVFEGLGDDADVTFLLKTVMLFERQKENSLPDIINNLKSRYVVISYPTKTLTKKDVGMLEHYREEFQILNKQTKISDSTEVLFENELVYISEI